MPRKDYYSILGVSRQATAEEIRKAYRTLARKYHPDVNKSEDAATRFAEVTEAYDVLSDAEKRKAYDRFGHAGVGVGHGAGAAAGRGPGPAPDEADFASFFQDIFGGGGGGGRSTRSPFGAGQWPGAAPAPPRRGANVAHTMTVSFRTAALGGKERLRLSTASGGSQTIDVKIPAGIESGANLRVRGQGQPGEDGGTSGDLILTVLVGQHPYFQRQGLDLLIDLPITIAESAFGATVTVPLLKGTAELKVPPGAASGQKLRIKGKGIAAADGAQGDFYAVIQIAAPEPLTGETRELLTKLGEKLRDPRADAPWAADVREA